MRVPLEDVAKGQRVWHRETTGVDYVVRPLDAFAYDRLPEARAKEDLRALSKIIARCLAPAMTFDDVFGTDDQVGLTPKEIGEVLLLASDSIRSVEALVSPNSEGDHAEPLMHS
jgi:hypothetical protein